MSLKQVFRSDFAAAFFKLGIFCDQRLKPDKKTNLMLALLVVILLVSFTLPAHAQPLPPDRVRLTTTNSGALLEWRDGGNDGATSLVRYEIGRSTNRGGAYAVIGNSGTALTYLDTTPVLGVNYYYAVRDVNSSGTTAWSDQVIMSVPVSGATIQANIYKNEKVVRARWPIYENEIVKTFVGLSTTPGVADITGFIDVGHATEHTFTGLSLAEGQQYYVTVRVQDTSGYLHSYGTSVCSSRPFIFDKSRDLTDDTADNYFNNALARVMTKINVNSVDTINFGNNALRRYRIPVTLIERGIESRFNAPVEINLSGAGLPADLNTARNQVRVADEWGNEVPCRVTAAAAAGSQTITEDLSFADFVEGFSVGGGEVSKPGGNLRLETHTNNGAVRTWVTDNPVDLTDWDEIEIDWMNDGGNNNNNRSYFVVANNRDGTFDNGVVGQVQNGRAFSRQTDRINVAAINGLHYIRVHANKNGANANRDSRISVYRITLRRQVDTNNNTLVLIANLPRGGSRNYWVHWGAGGTAPADFLSNSNDTSQRAWSQYYSRKLLPPGIEPDPISSWTKESVTIGDAYDRGGTWITLPWAFPYFSRAGRNTWFLAIKGTLTGVDYRDYSNTWNEFIQNSANRDMIAALWLDTSVRNTDPQPQNIGYYTLHKAAGSAGERFGFFWRANRYGMTDDIYMFQTFLYRFGDIAHRYEYLTYAGLFVQGQYDNPLNSSQHHTVGISHNNNNDYFWTTPLREGIGQTPTSFFQFKDAVAHSLGAVEDAGAGRGFAGHFDSHIFDSRTNTPNWEEMKYEVTANGGVFNFLIRSGSTPDPDASWSGWTQIASAVNANGSVAIPGTNNHRFIQYRCVFIKNALGSAPTLNRVDFICRGLEITQVTANTPDGVTQGQNGIPVTVTLHNFHTDPIEITSLELTFDLGSYTQVLDSHALPTTIGAGATVDYEFFVDVWEDSPTGLATIHAIVEGNAGTLDFSDDDADVPHEWLVKIKSSLHILQVDAAPATVNKGQTVLVRMYLENRGETAMEFDTASLTFSLGEYTQFVTSPPPGTILDAGQSMIATFSVTILPDSPSGVAIIDGMATGHNSLSNKIASTSYSEITDSWIIQNPAEIKIERVEAPAIVNRGQTNVPVKLTVTNKGEAQVEWERSFIMPYFTLGTYDSVNPDSVFPIEIFGGLAASGDYLVNIAPATATGTSAIDAMVEGIDTNTGFDVSDEYATFPASWTIIQEFVKTYSDPGLLFESESFNRPESGNLTLYAKSESLAPFHEYVVRWYDQTGTLVSFTNPPLTADDNGVLSYQLTIDSSAGYGNWTVRVTNPLNTHTACENIFSVVSLASLSVGLALPSQVTVGQPFVASNTFINSGGAVIESAYPGAILKIGPGDAVINSGPTPALYDVPGHSQATFTYGLTGTISGDFQLRGTGYGFDGNSSDFLTAASVTSNICEIQDPPQLVITDLSAGQIEVNLNQQGIVVLLSITNQAAGGVIPPDYYLYNTGTENVTFVAGYAEGTGDSSQAKQAAQLYVRARGNTTGGWNPTNETAERTYVTDNSVDLTNVSRVHIRWRNTGDNNNNNHSYFIISPNKNGASSVSTLNIARTRSFGWEEESIGVGGLSGNHYIRVHARDNDNGAQRDSVINVSHIWLEYEPLPAGHQAGAYVEAASLTFDFGSHSQVISAPVLPFLLAPGDTQIITFIVGVDADSDAGLVNISGSALARDENWYDKTYNVTGGAHSWTISGVMGLCSANSDYTPEQYAFNVGQTVYARFEHLPLNQAFRIRFYNDAPENGTLVKTSPPLNSGAFGICDDLWTLTAADPNTITRQWRVIIDNGNVNTVGTIFATQYFAVQNPGTLQATLSLKPDESFIGDTITATLQITNPDADASDIAFVLPSDLVPTAMSSGVVTSLTPISPASATISAQQTATFTWTFTATADTGLAGAFSMTADLAHSARGYDVNENKEVDSNLAVSNDIYIYSRNIEIASGTLQHSDLAPGESSDELLFEVRNIGNYKLEAVKWATADLKSENADYITKASFKFEPEPLNLIDAGDFTVAANSLVVPYNQPAGTYIATMSVYEDLNNNDARDFFEPYDLFSVSVPVPSVKNIVIKDDYIDLGNWTANQTTTILPLEFFNAGNLNLTNVKIIPLTGSAPFIIVSPDAIGAMPVAQERTSDVYAVIPSATVQDTYIATWTIFEDEGNTGALEPGDAHAFFQIRIGVGDKSFEIMPAPVHFGNATPTFTVENALFTVRNTGNTGLNNLRPAHGILDNGLGATIATDSLAIALPATVAPGVTEGGSVNIYIPAGTPIGTYAGTQWIFEDDNLNSVWDPGEASAPLELSVEVVEYRAVQVIPSTVSLGDLAPGTGGTISFWCRNLGNMSLDSLSWGKVNLISGANVITAAEYDFPPGAPFVAAPGAIFQRQISIGVPAGANDGVYSGNFGWLFEDMDLNSLRGPAEPQDSFAIALRVGNHSLKIIEPLVTTTGKPFSLSDPGVFAVQNDGTLTVSNPKATGTVLIGPETIPAAANQFTPVPIGMMVMNQTRSVNWRVQIPANTLAGTYTGTVTVWNDSDNDGNIDAGEAFATINVQLEVTAARIVEVLPSVLNLGWATENSNAEGNIEIINRGNVVLSDLSGLSSPISNAAMDSIANITFIPSPLGSLPIGDSMIATVSVTVSSPQSTGLYSGIQRVYDDYMPPIGSYTVDEESDTFELRISIGEKKIEVNPLLIDFGAVNPGSIANSANFTARNLTVIPLSRLRWMRYDLKLESAPDTIASASLTFTPPVAPNTFFSLGGSATNNSCSGSLVIGDFTPPGTYIGTATLWEDDNNNFLIEPAEASATVQTRVVVNAVSGLQIVDPVVDFEDITQGESGSVDVTFRNTGNVVLSDFSWSFSSINHVIEPVQIDAGQITPGLLPAPVAPGAIGTITVTIDVPAGQAVGIYGPTAGQTLFANNPVAVSDSCEFQCEVMPSTSAFFEMGPGSAYQEIATDTFLASGSMFFLSAWVCPGSGSANLALIQYNDRGEAVATAAVSVASDGGLIATGTATWPIKHYGSSLRVPVEIDGVFFDYYRVFMGFDLTYDEMLASDVLIVLQNSSPSGHSVWFDGIQLEKAFEGQTRPTSFSDRIKIHSPNRGHTLDGQWRYYEW